MQNMADYAKRTHDVLSQITSPPRRSPVAVGGMVGKYLQTVLPFQRNRSTYAIERNRSTYHVKPFYLSSETVIPFTFNLYRYTACGVSHSNELYHRPSNIDVEKKRAAETAAALATPAEKAAAAQSAFAAVAAMASHVNAMEEEDEEEESSSDEDEEEAEEEEVGLCTLNII
jgi:hypothetical protein